MKLVDFERTALEALIDEAPKWRAVLIDQLQNIEVTSRKNSGAGFFVDLQTHANAELYEGQNPLGQNTFARIRGLDWDVALIVHFANGQMTLLEGFTLTDEDTTTIDFQVADFQITSQPSLPNRN